jgi:5-hydroxyisourate hydrolase
VSTISTHVLDTSSGRPAAGVQVALERVDDNGVTTATIATATTDANGRIATWADAAKDLASGTYRLRFASSDYFSRTQRPVFYPEVAVTFRIEAADEHFHIPLLLSPFGYSTYRGS